MQPESLPSTEVEDELPSLVPFADHFSYLDARLTELKMALLWGGFQLVHGTDSLLGFSLDVDEQQLLINHQDTSWPIGWQLKEPDALLVKEQLDALVIDNRKRATLALLEGVSLPFESMREAFRLSLFEQHVMLFALAFVMDANYQKLYPYFHPRAHGSDVAGPSVRMACRLLAPGMRQGLEAMRSFSPKGNLCSKRLLVCQAPGLWVHEAPLEQRIFFVEPDMLLKLLGEEPETPEEVLSLPEESLSPTTLPPAIHEELQELMALFFAAHGPARMVDVAPGVMASIQSKTANRQMQERLVDGLVLVLNKGEQDRHIPLDRLGRHLALAAGRVVTHVDARVLLTGRDASTRLVHLFRDAQMQGHALFLEHVDAWLTEGAIEEQETLREQIASFTGLLLLGGYDGARKHPWGQKVCLHLRLDERECKLEQLSGPLVRRQVARRGLSQLEARLARSVVGQQKATDRLAAVVRTSKARLGINPERPDGAFLLVGPSGVGKTETAKALSDALHGDTIPLLRIDMSEFHFRESISALIGTTPGWVGYQEGGRLTNALLRHPETVVLLDEIEKAHPQVLDLFLQVFDDGRLTDGRGNTVDMSRATFLMTSNIGAHIFDKEHRLGFVKARTHDDFTKEIRAELRKELRPEFLNRIDEILVYFPLETDDLLQIGRRTLASLQKRFARRGIWLTVADDVYAFLVERVVGREGARSLQRLTEKLIARPLTELLLSSDELRMVEVIVSDGSICVQALQTHQQEV